MKEILVSNELGISVAQKSKKTMQNAFMTEKKEIAAGMSLQTMTDVRLIVIIFPLYYVLSLLIDGLVTC